MAIKPIRFEVSFQKLLSIVDQLGPDEKLLLRKKLEKQKLATWQDRFGSALQRLGRKNIRFPEKEVVEDVKKAIVEVRGSAKN